MTASIRYFLQQQAIFTSYKAPSTEDSKSSCTSKIVSPK
jgi:hypothetical protein